MRRRIVVRQERFTGAAGGEEMTADPLVAAMTPDTPVPRFERFRPAYSSGTVALSTRGSSHLVLRGVLQSVHEPAHQGD